MDEFLLYTISGLTTGGIYAITASGLTLTYTTTGTFNLAHGAVGMMGAFTYWQLHIGWGLPSILSFGIVLLVLAPLFGLGLERAVMRRLDGASDATKLVVSASLLIFLLSLALWVWDLEAFRMLQPLWPGKVWTWGILRVSYNDILVLAVAAVVAVGLRLLLFNTRAGVAMRATVDDRSLTELEGSRSATNARLAWAIGTSLAALAGILVAPKLNLAPMPLTLLIVNAYAAAVFGRLRSLPMTFVGALVLGLLNDYGIGYLPKLGVGEQYIPGFVSVVPVIVLFVVLVALPASRLRGTRHLPTRELSPRPTWGGGLALALGTVAASAMVSSILSAGDLFSMTKVWGMAIVGLSLVPLVGYAGRISLCQFSFAGIGAVVMAHMGGDGNPLAVLLAVGAAALVGVLVALPTLRLSGIYLALSTAAFAVLLDRWIFQLPAISVAGRSVNLFQNGSLSITRTRLGPLDLAGDRAYFIAGSCVFAACALLVVAIRRSDFGQRLLAMKDSPAASATIGVNVQATTLAVFALSASMAGLGGAVYGMGLRSATPGRFDLFAGTLVLLMMVACGVRSTGGALLAGLFLGGPTVANLFPSLTQLTSLSVGLVGIGLGRNPNGIVSDALRPAWDHVRRTPRVVAGSLAVLVAIGGARVTGVVGNWAWAMLTVAVVLAVPWASGQVLRRRGAAVRPGADDGDRADLAVEWLGLDGPVDRDELAAIDRRIGLPRVTHVAP